MNASLFDQVANRLAELARMSEQEARGTLRLTLKEAGLRPDLITPTKMVLVAERVLPRELQARNVTDPAGIGRQLARYVAQLPVTETTQVSPADFLSRLRKLNP